MKKRRQLIVTRMLERRTVQRTLESLLVEHHPTGVPAVPAHPQRIGAKLRQHLP